MEATQQVGNHSLQARVESGTPTMGAQLEDSLNNLHWAAVLAMQVMSREARARAIEPGRLVQV
jgi:hypothetical protein